MKILLFCYYNYQTTKDKVMITKIVMLENTEFSIHRPILNSVVENIKKTLFKNEEMYTVYLNNYEDSNFESSHNTYDGNTHTEYLEVYVDVESNQELAKTNTVTKNNNKPILIDPEIHFDVSPNTISTKFNIKFKYYNKAKNDVVKIKNKLKISSIKNSYYNQHELSYYFTLPIPLLALIKNIALLKDPNTVNYYNYINSIAVLPVDYINSKTKDYSIPVVKQKQSVIGNYETDLFEVNKIEQDDHGWLYEFDYLINVDTPESLLINYPFLVHNKSIDKTFIPKEDDLVVVEGNSDIMDALSGISSSVINSDVRNGLPIINYPKYDKFKPLLPTKYGMVRLLSLVIQLDPTNPNLLFNMNDFSSLIVNTSITDYLKTKIGTSLFKAIFDVFHFELFENDRLVDKEVILNDDMSVVATEDLDINKTYRIVLNAVYDLTMIFNQDVLTDNNIKEYIKLLEDINIRYKKNGNGMMYTVMITYIFANKERYTG